MPKVDPPRERRSITGTSHDLPSVTRPNRAPQLCDHSNSEDPASTRQWSSLAAKAGELAHAMLNIALWRGDAAPPLRSPRGRLSPHGPVREAAWAHGELGRVSGGLTPEPGGGGGVEGLVASQPGGIPDLRAEMTIEGLCRHSVRYRRMHRPPGRLPTRRQSGERQARHAPARMSDRAEMAHGNLRS